MKGVVLPSAKSDTTGSSTKTYYFRAPTLCIAPYLQFCDRAVPRKCLYFSRSTCGRGMEHGRPYTPRMSTLTVTSYYTVWKILTSCYSVKAHPSVNFTVIINPESGPGSGSLPDEAYLAEVPKLNAYDNVRTVGYVKTGWADNDLNTVVAEVNTYAAWSVKADNPLMSVDGIFFDESPSEGNATKREWLTTATQAVKDADGFGADQTVGTWIPERYEASPSLSIRFTNAPQY
jgi:hypothetical protein